jgi:hypothetical protein
MKKCGKIAAEAKSGANICTNVAFLNQKRGSKNLGKSRVCGHFAPFLQKFSYNFIKEKI